jgi:anti-sigma regulatory factor (Ser/Thr protein kinase)
MPSVIQNPPRWEMSIPNRLVDLMQAIEELSRFLEQCGADSQSLYLAQLAVEEMGTNIIKYGYDDHGEHVIRLGAECDESVFRIRVEDDGHEFNPCQVPEPDSNLSLQARTPGGWGISLVRRLVAGMDYERRDGRNLLRLVVPRCPAAPGS